MSLIINDKKVAGLYKAYVIQNATNTASGIIRIATEEEVKAGLDSLTAVTPKQLATKQDVLIAGNGLEILEDGTINNTQTSAEWGNIIGNILDQEDLNAILLTKANEEETAYELVYENSILTLKNRKGDTLSEVSINELPDVDDVTIVINEENKLQSIGEKTKSGTFKYTWIGTESEYTDAKDLGIIDEFTECIIIDSEAEKVVPIVQYEAPTKLSQLANDIEYITNDELQSVKTSLENKIDLQTDGAEIVHRVGNETIDGFKNFKQKIVIENGLGKGRIAHKPVDTSLEDGYIEFGDNTLLYGKQNIQGELYDEKHDIFHAGNLVAGNNITITKKDGVYKINGQAGGGTGGGGNIDNVDNETIIIQDDGSISAQGVLDQNTDDVTALKFWSGTLEEYEALGEWDDNTLYNVTDDVVDTGGLAELPIASTDTLGGVKVDGKTIKITEEGVISSNGGGLEIGDIGIAPLGIDETKGKRRYLNGQVIIQEQYVQFTNKVKSAVALYPSLACTEEEWQTIATMTVGGQVGKFVIDDEAGTIRLPKIIMPIQGLTDLSKLAEIVSAGLPNITGSFLPFGQSFGYPIADSNASGAFYKTTAVINGNEYENSGSSSTNKTTSFNFDASRSSAVYGNSNTVQQEQIQYPYFIQVATGAETEDNIINEIELNNPFSLLDYKFSEYELNNLSWLRSNGQYNSKAVYPAVYDLLLKIYNGTETKAGVSVKLTTETFTDYDFILNTAEETFRLPIKVKQKYYDDIAPVVGNGIALGLTDGAKNIAFARSSQLGAYGYTNLYGSSVGTASSGSTDTTSVGLSIGVTTDSTNSGIEAHLTEQTLYLYFYVGETVQNANLINAGRIEEKVASLIPDNSSLISGYGMPSNKYIDLTLGASGTSYTAPANGWVFLSANVSQAGGYVQIYKNIYSVLQRVVTADTTAICMMPVKKGEAYNMYYTSITKTNMFRFIYAEGEV